MRQLGVVRVDYACVFGSRPSQHIYIVADLNFRMPVTIHRGEKR